MTRKKQKTRKKRKRKRKQKTRKRKKRKKRQKNRERMKKKMKRKKGKKRKMKKQRMTKKRKKKRERMKKKMVLLLVGSVLALGLSARDIAGCRPLSRRRRSSVGVGQQPRKAEKGSRQSLMKKMIRKKKVGKEEVVGFGLGGTGRMDQGH